MMIRRKKIGVALGGGTIRGMTHIGVLETFMENDIPIDVLAGCSSGSIVAAAYACGRLKELKEIALALTKEDRRRMLDFCLAGEGIIRGDKLKSFFEYITAAKNFEEVSNPKLAFVAADVFTGEEVVLNKGSIAEALEKTTAVPGLAPLKRYEGKIVVDGGAAMMVPAKVAYDFGADFVVGVDVSAKRTYLTRLVSEIRKTTRESRIGKLGKKLSAAQEKVKGADENNLLGKMREIMKKIRLLDDYEKRDLNFMEMILLGMRVVSFDHRKGVFKDEECDLAIHPNVKHIRRTDISRTEELIKEGKRVAKEQVKKIKEMCNL